MAKNEAEREWEAFLDDWKDTNGDVPQSMMLMVGHLGRTLARACDNVALLQDRYWWGMGFLAALVTTGILVEVLK